ncbi:MAG: 5'-nucleotidase C-terminal domain-containing protein [Bacteroidales bacterium]|nr:5'-nucleotidase C-terminal domain-containing protein [Bacteroidales bacterium]
MKRITLIAGLILSCFVAMGQDYKWEAAYMDGSRTGTMSPSKDNVAEALGEFKGGKYIAPNGKTYRKRSIVGKTASIVMAAQPEMARVKDVIGYSTRAMTVSYPESALSDWFVDILMARTEKLSGKKVDIGVANFGGIRIDMPEGDIILDDMLSMFPFKNQLVYVEHTGKQIRTILEDMAADRFQVLGGVRVVAENGKLVEATIGGEPIDDDKVYGMATISFLLSGGDGLTLDRNALSVTVFENEDIIDAVLEYVHGETAAGRPIEYEADGRVVVKDLKNKKRK